MDKIRLGIIGMGNIGKYHADYLLNGKVSRCETGGGVQPVPSPAGKIPVVESFQRRRTAHQVRRGGRGDHRDPAFQHTTLGIAAFENGVHAMVEKPVSSHKADAERLVAGIKSSEDCFAGMFQLRTEPRYLKIQKLIQGGDLGEIVRVNWINTDWYRTEAYYTSSDWRATWKGEAAACCSINVCTSGHVQWLCGMPKCVRGFCQLGRFHKIEVETM